MKAAPSMHSPHRRRCEMSIPYHTLFHFLLYSPIFAQAPESNEARLVQRLIDALAGYDYRTDVVPTLTGAKVAAESDMAIGCFLLAIDGPNEAEVQALVRTIRHERGLDTPIYLVSELTGVESLSLEPLGEVSGYVYLDHETPAFHVKETIFALERYASSLKPPFFGALMDYDYEGNQMWTCPGHQGGAFYRRSPAGRLFVEHLGEAIFRNDIDNSVPELGDLLTRAGPAQAAQKEAAKVFGAERTYFVLNGTSTSNKVVTAALLKRGDLVLFDRNNHKSNHHGALQLAGAIPIYLETDRNPQGLIGPIDYDALDETDAARADPHPSARHRQAGVATRPTVSAGDHRAVQLRRHDLQRRQPDQAHRPSLRLRAFRRSLGRLHEVPPTVRRAFRHGARGPRCRRAPASSPRSRPTSSSRASRRPRRSTCATSTSRARRGAPSIDVSTRCSCCMPRRRRSTRCSPASMSTLTCTRAATGWCSGMTRSASASRRARSCARSETQFLAAAKDVRSAWFFDPFVPDVVTLADSKFSPPLVRVPWEDIPTDVLAREPACWALAPDAALARLSPRLAGLGDDRSEQADADSRPASIARPASTPRPASRQPCCRPTCARTTSCRKSATSTASCSC